MEPRQTRLLSVALMIAILLATAGAIYFAVTSTSQTGSTQYTEFYILGPEGVASDYPTNLTVGETGKIIVGITNHEGQRTTYTVALRLGENSVGSRQTTVNPGSTWEKEFTFTPRSTGRMRLRVLLFRGEKPGTTEEPYRSLRLWITVSERDTNSKIRTSSTFSATAGDGVWSE